MNNLRIGGRLKGEDLTIEGSSKRSKDNRPNNRRRGQPSAEEDNRQPKRTTVRRRGQPSAEEDNRPPKRTKPSADEDNGDLSQRQPSEGQLSNWRSTCQLKVIHGRVLVSTLDVGEKCLRNAVCLDRKST